MIIFNQIKAVFTGQVIGQRQAARIEDVVFFDVFSQFLLKDVFYKSRYF
jgi:hypothetical protein